ncbi:MAG: hypothetical protein Q7R66_18760 [Undibacterium sp.]|uniref:hypothetical protein n=1 Tax=Undibacterium sp. TaxID=1914977 RepID=UPI002716510C|nr:hypothetical protein [Undibacterium sp.]MDO8654217.1 hypothetical protein [Undibacterium sp.]
MANKEEIIAKLANEARDGWQGHVGERRAIDLIAFLNKTLANYSQVLGMSEDQIMVAIESKRDYSAINFYQNSKFPSLENVVVFESTEEVKGRYPSGKYRCPSCNGISTDPYVCNVAPASGKKQCDWKSYGLFGTLGKGLRVVVRSTFLEHPVVHEIFMPLEAEGMPVSDRQNIKAKPQ